jgi:hypothetical protein
MVLAHEYETTDEQLYASRAGGMPFARNGF